MAITPVDLGLADIDDSIARIRARESKFRSARQMIAKGNGHQAEDGQRLLKAELRQKALDSLEQTEQGGFLTITPGLGAEAHIGPRNNILSGEFLEIGILASRAVCRITRGAETGTGFLVGNGVVLTNHHVIRSEGQAAGSLFEFLFDDNTIGTPRNSVEYVAEPERLFWADEALDICFVALRESEDFTPLETFGWLPLLQEEGKVLIGDPLNILQHPRGEQKRVVVHECTFILVENDTDADSFCWYSGDTDKGSSGAPVLNNRWEVVALHHKAIPATDKNGHVLDVNGHQIAKERLNEPETQIQWIANEGIRISRIVHALAMAPMSDDHAPVRESLLTLWSDPRATLLARRASHSGMIR